MKLFHDYTALKFHISIVTIKLLNAVLYNGIVDIATTEVRISSRSLYLNCTFVNGNDGHIESAAAKIKDENHLLVSLLKINLLGVCKRGCCRLIDDSQALEAGNRTSVLCRLFLR